MPFENFVRDSLKANKNIDVDAPLSLPPKT